MDYHDPKWRQSRRKIVKELRESAEAGPPEPQKDWDIIWVLAGPESRFEEPPAEGDYNQTKLRLETGFEIVKKVTAIRLHKPAEEVTPEDIAKNGPTLYYNGKDSDNAFLYEISEPGQTLETQYHIPAKNVVITKMTGITNTGHQFEDYPRELMDSAEGKVVIVTDLFHLPRTQRTAKKHMPPDSFDRAVFYAAQPQKLPVRGTLREVKKILPYSKQGILPPED